MAGLTPAQCAEQVHLTEARWRACEAGDARLHPGLWDLFILRVRPGRGPDMPAAAVRYEGIYWWWPSDHAHDEETAQPVEVSRDSRSGDLLGWRIDQEGSTPLVTLRGVFLGPLVLPMRRP